MKKLITALLIGILLTTLGCGSEEVEDPSIPQSQSGIETPTNSAF